MKNLYLTILALPLLFLTGCNSTNPVIYEDPLAVNTLTTNIDLTDIYMISGSMVDSMLTSPSLIQITGSHRPIVIVDRIENRTDQHLDTVSISDSIRTRLIRSGKFRFTDKQSRDAQKDELEFQKDSGMVAQEKSTEMGKQVGAEYMVSGGIVSYVTGNSKQRRKAYKISMNLVNLETGLIEWADEEPIVKTQKRAKAGW